MMTGLSLEEAQSLICQVEAKHDLLQYQVDGWCIWPVLRFAVFRAIGKMSFTGRRRMPRSHQLAFVLRHDLPNLPRLQPTRYLFCTAISSLTEQVGDQFRDPRLDDLIQESGSYIKVDEINNPLFLPNRKAAQIKSNLSMASFDLTAEVLARLVGPSYINDIARSLSACIVRELSDSPAFHMRQVRNRLRYFYWYKKLSSLLLKRIQPSYIINSIPSQASLTAAAREQGITVVEIQHGVLHQSHAMYFWDAYARPYKDRIPRPDYFFLYGEYWKHILDPHDFWGESLRVVGHLRLDAYRQGCKRSTNAATCHLLLTTQGIEIESLITFVARFLELSRQQQLHVQLFIKLHPVYEADKTPYLEAFQSDEQVNVISGKESPSTFDLLASVDVHLSISSTCHYEALGLGTPTIILALPGHEIVYDLYQQGYAFLARSPEDLLALVQQAKQYEVPADIRDFFFAADALNNMKRALKI